MQEWLARQGVAEAPRWLSPSKPQAHLREVGLILLVPPKGHPVHTLTKIKKEPSIHSPKAEIETLLVQATKNL